MFDLKTKLKDSLKFILNVRFHQTHKTKALKALRQLEMNDSRKFEKQLKELCDDYALRVFGSKKYVYWLYVYAYVAKEFRTGWIPVNYYLEYVVKELKGLHGLMSGLRSTNRLFLGQDFFPDIGSYVNGLFLDEKGLFICESKISGELFKNASIVIFKQDVSERGLGIHFFTSTNFETTKIRELGNGVFQTYVKQHPDLAIFSSTSVSTLRITTVSTNSAQIQVRASNLRIGFIGSTHIESERYVVIPVDISSGKYLVPAYRFDWTIATKKDYGGEDFENKSFPKFSEACNLVVELHGKIPYVRCIGWDLVIDEKGEVKILEWNGYNNAIKFDEATQGPCFIDLGWEDIWRLKKD